CHVITVPRIRAHARDARELDQLVEDLVVARRQIFERRHPVSTAALSRSKVAWLCGRLPSSTSCISSISRETSGVATPASPPRVAVGPSCASVSVAGVRCAVSRRGPVLVVGPLLV